MTAPGLPANFGDSVASIGSYAFDRCGQLTNIIIPNTVTSIGSYAFGSCSRLTSAMLGNSVNSIGGYAFYDCTRLTNVLFEGNAPSVISTAIYADSRATVYYTPGTTGWGSTFAGLRAVLLNPLPFTASPTNGVPPLTVSFVAPGNDNAGNAIISWTWDFGDGGSSTLQNPTYTYASAGVFLPTVTAINDLGDMVLGGDRKSPPSPIPQNSRGAAAAASSPSLVMGVRIARS